MAADGRYIAATYARNPLTFVKADGVYLFDKTGKRYLDFSAGIAVNCLGHTNRAWVSAVELAANNLVHVSNLMYSTPQVELAARLVENSSFAKVFFSNSGTEANEAALKFARKVAYARAGNKPHRKVRYVAFDHGFHGRSMGSLSVTPKEKIQAPFQPLLQDVSIAQYNNIDSARAAIGDDVCGVIVEPIQGEGGVNPARTDFMRSLRQLCSEKNAMLIVDEVQCGLGRTGRLWAHEAFGIVPDMITLAKPLAGGLPIGAVLIGQHVADEIQPGDHGSTYSGNPLVCSAGVATFDQIAQPAFLSQVARNGQYLLQQLNALNSKHIVAIRSMGGLLIGVELVAAVKPVVAYAAAQGLVLITAGDNVIRLCPPLVISRQQIDDAVRILAIALRELDHSTNSS